MDRTIAGIPIPYWAGALIAGVVGFMWFRKRATGSSSPGASVGASGPAFSQLQETQDFQIFSALTGAQQASDLNFLGQVASLFAGGSSTQTPPSSTAPGGGSTAPAPPSTGTAPPATASTAKQPGYGLVNTAQGQMVWLGVNQAGAPIYNVGGGAPVYFGNAQALATGGQYEQSGYDIYTPASYANLVSSGTSNLGAAYT